MNVPKVYFNNHTAKWDYERQNNDDTEYIRADLAERPETDLLEESYMRGFAQGAKEERERMLEDIAKLIDTADKCGLNFGAECGFQIALDELEQRLTGKH